MNCPLATRPAYGLAVLAAFTCSCGDDPSGRVSSPAGLHRGDPTDSTTLDPAQALLATLGKWGDSAEYEFLLDDCELPQNSELGTAVDALDAWITGEGAVSLTSEELDTILSELKGSRSAVSLPVRQYRVVFDQEFVGQFQGAPSPRLDRVISGEYEVSYFRDEAQLTVGYAPKNVAIYSPAHLFRPMPISSTQISIFSEQFVREGSEHMPTQDQTGGRLLRFVKGAGGATRYTFKVNAASPWLPDQVWLRFTSEPRNVLAAMYRFSETTDRAGMPVPVEIVTFKTSDQGISIQSVSFDSWKPHSGRTSTDAALHVDRCPELRIVNRLMGGRGKGLLGCPPDLQALIRLPEGQLLRN